MNAQARIRRAKSASKTALQAAKDAEAAARLYETVQVLRQPHRMGDSSELRESVLGRFVDDYECGRECYEAGLDYFRLVYKWRRAMGIPNPVKLDEIGNSGGGDLNDEDVGKWTVRIRECEFALRRAGMSAFRATNSMILDDAEVVGEMVLPVKRALLSLAIEMGRFSY